MNLSIRQLRTLIAIVKHGKISHAAKAIGLTSPAVTLQLQQMEAELRAQLFLRSKTGVIPTAMGQIVIETARRVIADLDALAETVRSYDGLEKGSLKLGVVSTGKYFAPRLIAAFVKRYPGIKINLIAANRTETIKRLRDHEIDIALMGRPPTGFDVKATLFGDHPHVFIAPPDHPLAGRLDIGRSELASHQFLVREKGSGTRMSFEFFMANIPSGLQLPFTEMDSNETIKQAVMAGLGIAFISGHTIEEECRSGRLVILDVEDTPIRRHWYAIRHGGRTPTPTMNAMEEFLRTEGMQLLPIISKTYRSHSARGQHRDQEEN